MPAPHPSATALADHPYIRNHALAAGDAPCGIGEPLRGGTPAAPPDYTADRAEAHALMGYHGWCEPCAEQYEGRRLAEAMDWARDHEHAEPDPDTPGAAQWQEPHDLLDLDEVYCDHCGAVLPRESIGQQYLVHRPTGRPTCVECIAVEQGVVHG